MVFFYDPLTSTTSSGLIRLRQTHWSRQLPCSQVISPETAQKILQSEKDSASRRGEMQDRLGMLCPWNCTRWTWRPFLEQKKGWYHDDLETMNVSSKVKRNTGARRKLKYKLGRSYKRLYRIFIIYSHKWKIVELRTMVCSRISSCRGLSEKQKKKYPRAVFRRSHVPECLNVFC